MGHVERCLITFGWTPWLWYPRYLPPRAVGLVRKCCIKWHGWDLNTNPDARANQTDHVE